MRVTNVNKKRAFIFHSIILFQLSQSATELAHEVVKGKEKKERKKVSLADGRGGECHLETDAV